MAFKKVNLSQEQIAGLSPVESTGGFGGRQTGGYGAPTGGGGIMQQYGGQQRGGQFGGQDPLQMLLGMMAISKGQPSQAWSILGPEAESTNVKKRKVILNQAGPVLADVISSATKAPTGWAGWRKAKFGKIPGVAGGEAEFLERKTSGFARLIAMAFASEVGVATDRDVERWKGLMPKPGDTYEERIRVSQDLIKQIQRESASLGMEVPPSIMEAAASLGGGQQGRYSQDEWEIVR